MVTHQMEIDEATDLKISETIKMILQETGKRLYKNKVVPAMLRALCKSPEAYNIVLKSMLLEMEGDNNDLQKM